MQGPCAEEFKQAFACFIYSKEEDKGSDCVPEFRKMHECFVKHDVGKKPESDDEEDESEEKQNEIVSSGNQVETQAQMANLEVEMKAEMDEKKKNTEST